MCDEWYKPETTQVPSWNKCCNFDCWVDELPFRRHPASWTTWPSRKLQKSIGDNLSELWYIKYEIVKVICESIFKRISWILFLPRYVVPQGSNAIFIFHERVAVPAAKLKVSWISVGVIADEGTSRYTEICFKHTKTSSLMFIGLDGMHIWFFLLCCPLLSPQMVGATVAAPLTWKVSVQVPAVGWAIANETKSSLQQ
jgi:hypothetical protein